MITKRRSITFLILLLILNNLCFANIKTNQLDVKGIEFIKKYNLDTILFAKKTFIKVKSISFWRSKRSPKIKPNPMDYQYLGMFLVQFFEKFNLKGYGEIERQNGLDYSNYDASLSFEDFGRVMYFLSKKKFKTTVDLRAFENDAENLTFESLNVGYTFTNFFKLGYSVYVQDWEDCHLMGYSLFNLSPFRVIVRFKPDLTVIESYIGKVINLTPKRRGSFFIYPFCKYIKEGDSEAYYQEKFVVGYMFDNSKLKDVEE